MTAPLTSAGVAETVSVDRETLDSLQQIIEQQQQLKSQADQLQQQAHTLAALQKQVSELSSLALDSEQTVSPTPPPSATYEAQRETTRLIETGQDRVQVSVSGFVT